MPIQVKEGRTIYDNIRKFVRFSVAGNIGKVLVMLLAPFLGKPLPLLPLQLLWLNLLTDGLLGLGMGVEKAESDTMKRPPYSPSEGMFSRGAGVQVIWVGALIGGPALTLGALYFLRPRAVADHGLFLPGVRTDLAGAGLPLEPGFVLQVGLRGNSMLAWMVLLVTVLQLAVIYIPALNNFFSVVPLSPVDLFIAIGTVRLLNREIFYTLQEAQILTESWRQEDNTVRSHSALGYRPPAPEALEVISRDPGYAMLRKDLWLDFNPTLT